MSEEIKKDGETAGTEPTAQPEDNRSEAAPETAPSEPQTEPAPAASAEEAAAPSEPAQAAEPAASTAEPAAEGGEAAPPRRKETEEEKAARRKAALEAREAAKAGAAQAKAAEAAAPAASSGDGGEPAAPPKPPSPNQPRLDRAVQLLKELVAEDAVEEASLNELNDDLPTLVVKNERWPAAAVLFRDHEELGCRYLRNVSGVDYETYMEVVYYPLNMERRETYCVKVRTDRENPSVPSVTPVWETANWNEREIYDLLGIDFPGHPNMTRIMMPDDWVGHPLRKDYVPLDPEV
ncbi:NADH-quinone oxidoreductase subunit C [Cohnella caldifontis]|uniref:NADH-quinone oxidoreductase subunit C n=1 Tax=Cohnella caldifontis TaxID=3027471 RepID=UPI0023EDB3DE|nr:NADH-quinone oxidoreductase subunit C [Cohnella sp. YIM B05605]